MCISKGVGVWQTEKNRQTKNLSIQELEKNLKNRAILYNWKTADQIEAGIALNNGVKRAENTPGWQHAT